MHAALNNRWAFSLLELLVVIAIIAILAALLLPELSRSKAVAKRVQCTNNQKQMAAVWTMYAADNLDWLAANGSNNPATPSRPLWIQGTLVNPNDNTNFALLSDPSYALFGNYIRVRQIYRCPTDRETILLGNEPFPRVRSYALNVFLGWIGLWDERLPADGFRVFHKQSDLTVAMPCGTFLLQDVNPDSICWPYFGVDMIREAFFNWPNSSHNSAGVISFADGHVEGHRWVDPRTLQPTSANFHQHNDASLQNSDLAWLRERTTVHQ